MAITPREEQQQIRELHFIENLKFLPQYVENFFVNNIVQRSLAHLVGWTGKRARMLICTSAGILKVAPIGTGFEHAEVHSANAVYNNYHDLAFANECSRWDIWVYENPIMIKQKNAIGVWEGETELPADSFFSFDCYAQSIEVKNVTSGDLVHCQVRGYY